MWLKLRQPIDEVQRPHFDATPARLPRYRRGLSLSC